MILQINKQVDCTVNVFKPRIVINIVLLLSVVQQDYRQQLERHFVCGFKFFKLLKTHFLARDPFVRTNRRAIAMMFIRLFSVRPSVCLSGTGVHCDRAVHVHFSTEFSLQAQLVLGQTNVLGILTPKHVHLFPAVFFQFHLEQRWGMDVQTRRKLKR